MIVIINVLLFEKIHLRKKLYNNTYILNLIGKIILLLPHNNERIYENINNS